MAITRKTTIAEIIRRYPGTVKVFKKYNMGCTGCMGAETENIESGALMHGLNPLKLLRELNRVIGK